MRDVAKGAAWKKCGCEVALADMNDAPALTAAFTGASGVFVLIPSNFDPEPGFPEVRAIIDALASLDLHYPELSPAKLKDLAAAKRALLGKT